MSEQILVFVENCLRLAELMAEAPFIRFYMRRLCRSSVPKSAMQGNNLEGFV